MVKLFDCQSEVLKGERYDEDEVKEMVMFVLSRVLEISPNDLTPDEEREIEFAVKDWIK